VSKPKATLILKRMDEVYSSNIFHVIKASSCSWNKSGFMLFLCWEENWFIWIIIYVSLLEI